MRVWFSGPRILGGLVRPGISLGKEDLRAATPPICPAATLGLFRRPDGAILMAIADMNGDAENMPGAVPVAAFGLPSMAASVEIREGARVRLAKHIGQDGLVAGLSVGQVVAAIKAEAGALGVDAKFARVEVIDEGKELLRRVDPPVSSSDAVAKAGAVLGTILAFGILYLLTMMGVIS